MGGGRRSFRTSEDGGNRIEGDLIEEYQKHHDIQGTDYRYIETADDLRKWKADGMTDYVLGMKIRFAYRELQYHCELQSIPGLFSNSHMKYMTDREENDEQPTLSEMADAAIERLQQSDEGFFLLVEGGRIDHAHHDNFAKRAMEETIELENAVKVAMEKTNPEDTLIIVTADHSHSVTINGYPIRGTPILGSHFHNPYSMSPYPTGENLAYATISYANGLGYFDHVTNDINVPWKDFREFTKEQYEDPDFRQPAMMPPPEVSETHGGEDVGIFARGNIKFYDFERFLLKFHTF